MSTFLFQMVANVQPRDARARDTSQDFIRTTEGNLPNHY